jgi:hypothetical protein
MEAYRAQPEAGKWRKDCCVSSSKSLRTYNIVLGPIMISYHTLRKGRLSVGGAGKINVCREEPMDREDRLERHIPGRRSRRPLVTPRPAFAIRPFGSPSRSLRSRWAGSRYCKPC